MSAPQTNEEARFDLAYLIWAYIEGYGDEPYDRDTDNWMLGDESEMHSDDATSRRQLLLVADKILSTLSDHASEGDR